jgi:uncharacterized protein (DUF983 family)
VNPDLPPDTKGQPGLGQAALFGLCPRCGARTLFGGLAQFAPRCSACGLDFTQFNVGDGPAAFLTLVVGALVVILGLWLHFKAGAPIWLIMLLLLAVTAGLVIGGLRVAKAALLAAEFQRRAGEGRLKDQ